MTTSITSLLKAVLDDPSDLNRRLVYADALQDRGDPRGEFIAHHIAGRPEAATLLKKHAKEWIAFLHPAVSRAGLRFVNGFVERVTFKVEHLDMLSGCLDREPIHEMRFRDLNADASRLAAMPDCTSRITWLDLKHAHLSGGAFATLMKSRWDRLWRIWAPSNALGDIGVQALIDASPRCLKSLNLHGAHLRDRTLFRLAAWPGLAQIEEFNIRANEASDDAIAALLSAAGSLRWIGLPLLGPLSLEVLAGKSVKTVESLVVSEAARSTIRSLKQIFGKRFEHNSDYGSRFDINWP